MKILAYALFGVLLLCGAAKAQQSTQQSATRLDAATLVGTSASTGATISLTCGASTFAYVTAIEFTNCAGASAVTAAAVTTVTTTNLGGAAWTMGSGVTAGLCQPTVLIAWTTPFKSSTNLPTIVLPTFATNQTIRVSAYYYCAP